MNVSAPSISPSNAVADKQISARLIRVYLAILCLLAAIRIFVGSTMLPILNDVDESSHFDLVCKYARGFLPERSLSTWETETASISFYFCTFEYLHRPERFKEFDYVYPPPIWKLSKTAQEELKIKHTPALLSSINHESQSPPLYYVIAAVWYRTGKLVGLTDPHSAYFIRLLNIPLHVLLIIAAYRFCRAYFSDLIACSVAAMVAFFPSTIFFSINNDVLCPLVMLAAVWLMLRWCQQPDRNRLSVLTGLAVSACVLTKLTNIAVYLACGFIVVAVWFKSRQQTDRNKQAPSIGLLVFCAIAPFFCWMIYNRVQIGDWTATVEKVRHLGWTSKPWQTVFDHPLLTLAGQQEYWNRFCTSFYAGDMNWHGTPWMTFFPLNVFAWISFAVLPIGVIAYLRQSIRVANRHSLLLSIACTILMVGSIAFLWFLSMKFDFGACLYPSQKYPYFNSGRLVYGILVPFLAFYAYGVATLTRWNRYSTILALTASVVILIPAQVILFLQTINSQSNWFHTPM